MHLSCDLNAWGETVPLQRTRRTGAQKQPEDVHTPSRRLQRLHIRSGSLCQQLNVWSVTLTPRDRWYVSPSVGPEPEMLPPWETKTKKKLNKCN